MLKQRFDLPKAIEVLVYITQEINNTYNALKVLYFADKDHLSRYGRLISGDKYIAMDHGPVPSNIYDIVKEARGDSLFEFDTEENLRKLFKTRRYMIKPNREPNCEYLSESDIECLNRAIKKYGGLKFDELKDKSHDEAFNSADYNGVIPLKAIIKTLPNAEELLAYYEIAED